MTAEQKLKVQEMRQKGLSYFHIASTLQISINTIKSYCRRNNLAAPKEDPDKEDVQKSVCEIYTTCRQCGKSFDHGKSRPQKKFCSEKCRRAWWKINDSYLDRKAWYTLTCAGCGKEFESYGNKNRKFCRHACYINKRFKKLGDGNDTRAV